MVKLDLYYIFPDGMGEESRRSYDCAVKEEWFAGPCITEQLFESDEKASQWAHLHYLGPDTEGVKVGWDVVDA